METVKTIVPIDLEGLKALSDKGKENPTAVRTLKCKTVQTDKFRHENYVRDLDAHIIDEPPLVYSVKILHPIRLRQFWQHSDPA